MIKSYNLIKETARDLRKNQTEGERILWEALRNRKLAGKKFLRQHPIVFETDRKQRFFIADFYCGEEKLVIEVDGGIHEKIKDNDAVRDDILNDVKMKVIRISDDLVKKDLARVLKIIREKLTS